MNEIVRNIIDYIKSKKILILGFGKEGQSSYRFIRQYVKDNDIIIADRKQIDISKFSGLNNDKFLTLKTGEEYLETIYDDYDIMLKSPGIPFKDLDTNKFYHKISSQMDLLIKFRPHNTVGITGTKGKSTTATLLYNIVSKASKDVVLAGNIGIPVFDIADKITDETILILEISSHQLEFIKHSPDIAVLMNIYEEHLDHYKSYEHYKQAKLNIFKYQKDNGTRIYSNDNEVTSSLISELKTSGNNDWSFSLSKHSDEVSINMVYTINGKVNIMSDGSEKNMLTLDEIKIPLLGKHNMYNILACIIVSDRLRIDTQHIKEGIETYKTLPHRLEYLGDVEGIDFYNDSISTIPETTIYAIDTVKNVDTVIVGGYDRGIDYTELANYLCQSSLSNIILLPDTGGIIARLIKFCYDDTNAKVVHLVDDLDTAVKVAKTLTPRGKACVFSPASSSYNKYKNFEERGNHFRNLVLGVTL